MANRNAATFDQYVRTKPEGGDLTNDLLYAAVAANAVNGDVIRFGILPKGSWVPDLHASTDAANAAATLSFGWAYVDGSAASAAEFMSATSVATAGLIRANGTGARTILAKDAYLTATIGGATFTNATNIRVRPVVSNRGTP